MLHRSNGLHTASGEAPSTDRQEANAAFILAEHTHRPAMLRRNDALELRVTGRLELSDRLRVFLCDWAVPP